MVKTFTIIHLRFTIYDLRFGKFARLRRGDAEQVRTCIHGAVYGRGEKAAVAPSGAYVRCTTYDVRFAKLARVARDGKAGASGM